MKNRYRPIGYIIFIISSIVFGNVGYGQDSIVTERPTQSIGSLVLPSRSFQYEHSFTFNSDTKGIDSFFRLGISELGYLSNGLACRVMFKKETNLD